GDLLAVDEEELAGLLEEWAELVEGLEADAGGGGGLVVLIGLDPILAEAGEVAGVVLDRRRPQSEVGPVILGIGEDVVIGEREEVVAIALVPVHDHFGVLGAVAPEGMRVEVALPPAQLEGGGR